MKNISKAFNFLNNQGQPLNKEFTCSIETGTKRQIDYAKCLIGTVLAEIQGTLNVILKDLRIKDLETLESAYNEHDNNSLKGIELMINATLSAKKATSIIEAFSGYNNQKLRNILKFFPKLQERMENEDINF